MPDAQSSLMLIVVQLGLMSLAWGCLAIYVHEARPVIFSLIGYSLAAALGLAVLSVPGSMQRPMQQAFANACVTVALLLLCRGASGMWSIRLPRLAFVVVPWSSIALIVGGEGIGGQVFFGESVTVLIIAWILVVGPLYIFKAVRAEFGTAAAWVLLLSGIGVAWGQIDLLARALRAGSVFEFEMNHTDRFATLAVLLAAIFASNLAFAFALVTRLVRQLGHLSRHDALTGLLNRRAMMEAVEQEWERHRRHGVPFTLLALDIDHFKRINDGHGHPMGDEVLRRMGAILGQTMRRTDRVGRTGGEEFIAMLVGSDAASAASLAELVRRAVANGPWPPELASQGGVTVSIGLAEADRADRQVTDLLTRADAALYRAKAGGRNRVVGGVIDALVPGLLPSA